MKSIAAKLMAAALLAAVVLGAGGCVGQPSGSMQTNVTIRSFGSHSEPRATISPEARKYPAGSEVSSP